MYLASRPSAGIQDWLGSCSLEAPADAA